MSLERDGMREEEREGEGSFASCAVCCEISDLAWRHLAGFVLRDARHANV